MNWKILNALALIEGVQITRAGCIIFADGFDSAKQKTIEAAWLEGITQ